MSTESNWEVAGKGFASVAAPLALLGLGGRGFLGNSLLMGMAVSFGGDSLEAGATFKGSSFMFGENASDVLRGTVRGYGTSLTSMPGTSPFTTLFSGRSYADDIYTKTPGFEAGLRKGGLSTLLRLNIVAPALFTGVGTVNAMMDGGLLAGGEYLLQDFLGMDAARRNLNMVYNFDVNNAKQVAAIEKRFQLGSGAIESGAKYRSGPITNLRHNEGAYNVQRTIMSSPLLGQLFTMAGGVIGAGLGMEAGKALGKQAATHFLGEDYAAASGVVGALFGGYGGAQIGAAMFASVPRAIAAGLGIAAGYYISKGTYGILQSGFKKERHSKGLNFASDTSQFMTQQAVTMRQRAMQAMHKSHLNARSAFGQEATITHMNRDMFSHYKR